MRKIFFIVILCALASAVHAVPAKPGWQTYAQGDGTTIELQLVGDEYYHYMINREGQQVHLNAEGMYVAAGQAPTRQQARARRAYNKVRRVRKEFGVTPNLAPRGIVIMVNYTDKAFQASHTNDVIDSLCNAEDCQVNEYYGTRYPSARTYFKDQSNGEYAPVFDVYGPVTLSRKGAYYGENDVVGNDARAANMIVEACKTADKELGVDFTQYDSDNDGKVDFVYVIYAGKGEASGGSATTIWPHSYSITEQLEMEEYYTDFPEEFYAEYGEEFVPYFTPEYSLSDCYVDGKMINTYACSNELSDSGLDGIGTLCHEFGHVMGLPDFYDIYYGYNDEHKLTPGKWDVMDGGAYNGGGHCPPNYNAWEKYFFGWHTPVNPGSEPARLQLTADGQDGYQAYQITDADQPVGPTDSLKNNASVYYIENRQKQGWDSYLPGHGLIAWKVNYSKTAWQENTPNSEDRKPRFTVAQVSGSWDKIAAKPLKDITEKNGVVSLVYISEPPFKVTWMANGEVLEVAEYAADGSQVLVAPKNEVVPCEDGTMLRGWTVLYPNWADPFDFPPDMDKCFGEKVTEDLTIHAVFSEIPLPCCEE